jgi:glycosyltransferase involved in cell wall biosynthesis
VRIVHVVPSIANPSSGPTYTVTRLCKQLIEQGHDVTLACTDEPNAITAPQWVKQCSYNRLAKKLRLSPTMRRWLYQECRGNPGVILHSNSLWEMPCYYAARAAKLHGVACVAAPHGALGMAAFRMGSLGKRVMWRLWQRRALEQAACLHATALSEAKEFRVHGFRQPIAIVPNGIDVPLSEVGSHARRRELLFLGRVHPKKGIDVLLPAWRRVQAEFPDWWLRIAGPDNGGHLDRMRTLGAELGVERVNFAGELLGELKADAYQRASVFVLPTRNENFGIAVAEALSHGAPAIVTKGAPWGGLQEHRCGWWVDFGVEPLVPALREAMSTAPSELYEMGQRGRRWMSQEFSWHAIGAQMEEVYDWILRGRHEAEAPATIVME